MEKKDTTVDDLKKEIKRLRAEILESNKSNEPLDDERTTRYTEALIGILKYVPTGERIPTMMRDVVQSVEYLVDSQKGFD